MFQGNVPGQCEGDVDVVAQRDADHPHPNAAPGPHEQCGAGDASDWLIMQLDSDWLTGDHIAGSVLPAPGAQILTASVQVQSTSPTHAPALRYVCADTRLESRLTLLRSARQPTGGQSRRGPRV